MSTNTKGVGVTMMTGLRNSLILGACYAGTSTTAFTSPTSSSKTPTSRTTALHRSSNGFVGFQGDGNPDRGGGGGGSSPNSRRPMDDPFAPSRTTSRGPPPRGAPQRGAWEEPASVDLGGRVTDRQSNLARQTPSVNDDPRAFDMDRRFSQRPRSDAPGDPSGEPRRAWWDSPAPEGGRIQGGSRHTYAAPHDRDASHTFVESDGRPLDVEMEIWDGPNNTPTRVKMYSEDGRQRPMNILTNNPQRGRGNTMSVRNTGPMEFPLTAGVRSVGATMSPPSGIRPSGLAGSEGAYLTEHDLDGFTNPASPSTARGEVVQGGALRTFPLDYSVEAVQVTIKSEGLPVNAKVELWGTSSHIKQLAEVYNDNGLTRPFAAIIDVPGGSNTVAVYNTGPMEYPIRVVVEPVARMEGWDGREESVGGTLAPW